MLKQTNLSLFLETRVLSTQEESADSFLSALRKPLPSAFLTVAAVGNNERVTVRNLTAGVVHDRKEMSAFDVVLLATMVSRSEPRARGISWQESR